jgi:RNA polymerase sigma-70 factor, ECF subfamily
MHENPQQNQDIEILIKNYGNDVLRTAYMYVKDIHTAEDIFQDVFIKVSQKLNTFKGDSNIKTWIIRITINASKDYLKSAWKRRVIPINEYHENTLTSKNEFKKIEQLEESQLVRDAVMELPGKYKDIIICVYFQDMTVKEAAMCLNLAEGTAKSRLSRARQKLRIRLEGRV